MSFEIISQDHAQRRADSLGRAQSKVDTRVELPVPAKKILSVRTNCFLASVERADATVILNGRATTRVIFIDETDSFNSAETTQSFTEKMILKNSESVTSVWASMHILDASPHTHRDNSVETTNLVDVQLMGVLSENVSIVSNLTGSCETRTTTVKVNTLRAAISERFEADDIYELDKDVLGVLGVDASAWIRDIVPGDKKFTLKGTVCSNIMVAKTGETSTISAHTHEFDFAKTINLPEMDSNDIVAGSVAISNINMTVSARGGKNELNIDVELNFNGLHHSTMQIETLEDAITFEHTHELTRGLILGTKTAEQAHFNIDVEGNIMMPEGSPFISRILATTNSRIAQINLVPADDKLTVEGLMECGLVFECEERIIHHHTAKVPFSFSQRVTGISATSAITASLAMGNCKVRARRGKELLVDASIALNLSTVTAESHNIVTTAQVLGARAQDESAILIFSPQDGETLWDIAKRVNIPSSQILAQNPGLDSGSTNGNIFIYRQSVVSF